MTIHIELNPTKNVHSASVRGANGWEPDNAHEIIRDHIGNPPDGVAQQEATHATLKLEDLIDHEFIASCARPSGGEVPTIEEVRESLAKIPGSLAEDIIADREDRF